MKAIRYKLQLVRVEYRPDAYFPGTKNAVVIEKGPYLQTNGEDVLVKGYAAAITRAGELNDAIRREGKWEDGWRFHTIEHTMEEQTSLLDNSGDQANVPA